MAGAILAVCLGADVDAVAAVGICAVIAVAVLILPGDAFNLELSEWTVGGATLKRRTLVEAAERAPDEAADKTSIGGVMSSMLDLRLALEAKLVYLAKHVLGTPDRPAFITVGSLKVDGLLPSEEAEVCSAVMAGAVPEAKGRQRRAEEWEELAGKVVRGFRATVFAQFVRKTVQDAGGAAVQQEIAGLPRALRVDGERSRVVIPVFARPGTEIFNRAAARAKDLDGALLVTPDCLSEPVGDGRPPAKPNWVSVSELPTELARQGS